jgi:alditol oxidase
MSTPLSNWAGNFQYSTASVHYPKTVAEVQQLVRSHPKIKILGTKHSFNSIADSKHQLMSLYALESVMQIDKKAQTVTVSAGIRYGELAVELHKNGFALHNLGSLPHISVAGACVTATHGSGMKNGILASAVLALEIVTAAGDVLSLSRENDGEKFDGCVVNLGALGVVTKLTLRVHPTFYVKQEVFENLPLAALNSNLLPILSHGYSVSLFTNWRSDVINQVWIKTRVEENTFARRSPEDFFGATPTLKNVHPIPSMPAENCTEQMSVHGPWHERLPHFRMEFTPSSGEELQSEYFVPLDYARQAIMAINELRDRISPYLLISELRTIDRDQLWMSPCYNQPCLAIHFTWKQIWGAVKQLLPMIETSLTPYNARPHWAKLFTMEPSRIQSRYKRLPDFRALVLELDPEGKFRNDFLELNLF